LDHHPLESAPTTVQLKLVGIRAKSEPPGESERWDLFAWKSRKLSIGGDSRGSGCCARCHGGSKTEVRLVSLICRSMSISSQPGAAEYRRRRGAFVNSGVGPVSTFRFWRDRRRAGVCRPSNSGKLDLLLLCKRLAANRLSSRGPVKVSTVDESNISCSAGLDSQGGGQPRDVHHPDTFCDAAGFWRSSDLGRAYLSSNCMRTLSTLSMPSTALPLGNAAVAIKYRSSTRVVIESSACEAILTIKVRGGSM
jgi:hypothetical protein